ncbi:nucleoside-diphosphate-sugar epimerase [Bradyrhizobium diazoefficiens]
MRAAIFGSGQIGTFVGRALEEKGSPIVIADVAPAFGFVRRFGPRNNVVIEQADICDHSAVSDFLFNHRPDIVINAVGVLGAQSASDPTLAHSVNTDAAISLAIAAQEAGVKRLIHISSISVYGSAPTGELSEDDATKPVSIYGQTKLAAERGILTLAPNGMEVLIIRPAGVYGPIRFGSGSRSATFLDQALIRVLRGENLEVHVNRNPIDDFIYVKDLAAAVATAAYSNYQFGGDILNVGSGRPSMIQEVEESLRNLNPAVNVRFHLTADQASEYPASVLSIEKACGLLGFKPQFNLKAGLEDHAAEYGLRPRL